MASDSINTKAIKYKDENELKRPWSIAREITDKKGWDDGKRIARLLGGYLGGQCANNANNDGSVR